MVMLSEISISFRNLIYLCVNSAKRKGVRLLAAAYMDGMRFCASDAELLEYLKLRF